MLIVTDGQNLQVDLCERLKECIEKYSPNAIYLREKHLTDEEYLPLATNVMKLCEQSGVDFYVCHRCDIAKKICAKNFHTNVQNLEKLKNKCDFNKLSVAIHSEEEIKKTYSLGATNLVYGHIFATKCKENLAPRGLESLKKICDLSSVPVIAIGGINRQNFASVLECGASDFAIMSSAMDLTF